uniref:Uncharacterized protein n=2 Tax=viral metagenome TaxID=1070528 RepID=A0A6M3JFH5_9ZZZZ
MNKEELIKELERISRSGDAVSEHIMGDKLLLRYINDKDIADAFEELEKWYGNEY